MIYRYIILDISVLPGKDCLCKKSNQSFFFPLVYTRDTGILHWKINLEDMLGFFDSLACESIITLQLLISL